MCSHGLMIREIGALCKHFKKILHVAIHCNTFLPRRQQICYTRYTIEFETRGRYILLTLVLKSINNMILNSNFFS